MGSTANHVAEAPPAPQPAPDPLDEAVTMSIKGTKALRARIKQLEAQLDMSEREALILRTENEVLRTARDQELAAHADQLDAVNAERAYYHRFAIEVATSLNLVGQVCDEVMSKAQQEAFREGGAPVARGGALPQVGFPQFLNKGPMRQPGDAEPDKPQGGREDGQ